MQDVRHLTRRIVAVGRLRAVRQGHGGPSIQRIIGPGRHGLFLRPGRLELGDRPGPIRHCDFIELTGERIGPAAPGADAQATRRQAGDSLFGRGDQYQSEWKD